MSEGCLVISAISLSISLLVATKLNSLAHGHYERIARLLRKFETNTRLRGDESPDIKGVQIAVFGMGRVGSSAYDAPRARFGDVVVGFDSCERVVNDQLAQGRNVHLGDAIDAEFWERVEEARKAHDGELRLVLLAMCEHKANLEAVERIRCQDPEVFVAATGRYDDQVEELRNMGVTASYNLLSEAGSGFAEHVYHSLQASGE